MALAENRCLLVHHTGDRCPARKLGGSWVVGRVTVVDGGVGEEGPGAAAKAKGLGESAVR